MAGLVSHDVETEVATIELASATQGRYREFMSGRKSWTISSQCLMVTSAMMISLLQVGQTFAVSSYDRDSATANVHGQARLERCTIQMTYGKLVRGQFQFRGYGNLFAQITHGDFNFDFNSDFKIL